MHMFVKGLDIDRSEPPPGATVRGRYSTDANVLIVQYSYVPIAVAVRQPPKKQPAERKVKAGTAYRSATKSPQTRRHHAHISNFITLDSRLAEGAARLAMRA
jgi:hypothetical protein